MDAVSIRARKRLGHGRVAFALFVHGAEIVLGGGVALLGDLLEPIHRLRVVPRHAVALDIHYGEAALSNGITLLCKRAQFFECRRVVATFVRGFGFVAVR